MTWQDHAACAGAKPELFYPTKNTPSGLRQEALDMCHQCPVQVACLEDDLTTVTRDQVRFYGIRGGYTAKQREALARQRRNRQRVAS